MRALGTDESSLVRAAQAGDRRALDDLVAASLPLVYNLVGRALSGHPDADDVVQETMLRAVRELGSLRAPQSFRAWLAAIAVRQVGTYRRRRRAAAHRVAALDETEGMADAGADFENLTVLRLGLSGQRREAVLASRWLDAGDRALLSLWWLETAGEVTRPELAAAMGLTVAHAGVRVQRMLDQLELSRALVAALVARPRCAALDVVAAGWDGRPARVWRKRIGRHVRGCATCARAGEGLVPTARLLFGAALVPVPVTLAASLAGTGAAPGPAVTAGTAAALPGAGGTGPPVAAAGAKAGVLAQLAAMAGAHPVVTMLVAGAVIAGAVVAAAPAPRPSLPPVPVTSPATTTTLALGRASLEAVSQPGWFVAQVDGEGVLTRAGGRAQSRRAATFEVVEGLANRRCVSLRGRDGRYLRHSSWRLRLSADNGTVLFRDDATFCPRAGATAGSVTLESFNYPGRFLRHAGGALWVDPTDGTAAFHADASFLTRPPLAG